MCQLTVKWHICDHLVTQEGICQFKGLSEHKIGEAETVFVGFPCWLCRQPSSEFVDAMLGSQLRAQDVINALGISSDHPDLLALIGQYFDRYENSHLRNMAFGPLPESTGPEGLEQDAHIGEEPMLDTQNAEHTTASFFDSPQPRAQTQGLEQNTAAIREQTHAVTADVSSNNGDQVFADLNADEAQELFTSQVPADESNTVNPTEVAIDRVSLNLSDFGEHFATMANLNEQPTMTDQEQEPMEEERAIPTLQAEAPEKTDPKGKPSRKAPARRSTPVKTAAKGKAEKSPAKKPRTVSGWQKNESQLESLAGASSDSPSLQGALQNTDQPSEFLRSNLHHLAVMNALNNQLETQGPNFELVQALSKEVSDRVQEMSMIGERWHELSTAAARNINRYVQAQAAAEAQRDATARSARENTPGPEVPPPPRGGTELQFPAAPKLSTQDKAAKKATKRKRSTSPTSTPEGTPGPAAVDSEPEPDIMQENLSEPEDSKKEDPTYPPRRGRRARRPSQRAQGQ